MNHVAKPLVSSAAANDSRSVVAAKQDDSLFDRFAWIYIFCREKVFRDDTERMIGALWPDREPGPDSEVLELGCGPGFYSRALAERFPRISVLGIDSSKRLIDYARAKARSSDLRNCAFKWGNVLDLPQADDSFSELIASRLFTILPERERVVAEMFRVLSPGGKCFVAEPRFAFSASIPLVTMRVLSRLSGYSSDDREPTRATALPHHHFRALFATQPWSRLKTWRAGRYQHALCEKG